MSIFFFHYICFMFLFLGASSCASAASWVISSVCLQIDNREVFCDQRGNRNSVKNCIFREKLIEIILKITAKSFSLVASCHSSFFSSLLSAHQTGTPLHPSSPQLSTLCFFFESSTLGSWLCCFQCRLPLHESSLQALEDLPFSKSYTKSIETPKQLSVSRKIKSF